MALDAPRRIRLRAVIFEMQHKWHHDGFRICDVSIPSGSKSIACANNRQQTLCRPNKLMGSIGAGPSTAGGGRDPGGHTRGTTREAAATALIA